ncbi:beta strand repeat-containing protein [Oleomonas cavernae]|uniref:beta strand repeat-containing protein n=1 Tax=Oleomonas cavernae TaxID=2320859 RepID=UPI0013145CAC|nr:calcium-binding protein [Oleomonas cavernae]
MTQAYWSSTGGPSADHIEGGSGDDVLNGAGGNDELEGWGGNDTLIGGAGGDRLYGGDGIDTASYAASSAGVTVNLTTSRATGHGLGNDYLHSIENVIGTQGADDITGDGLANTLDGGVGDDHLKGLGGNDILIGGLGSDRLDGGDGADTASYANASSPVTVNLLTGTATGDGSGTDTLISVENVTGTVGADDITGDAAANRLEGRGGADFLRGGLGDDTYVINDLRATIVEAPGGGIDTVLTALSTYTLGAGVENLTHIETAYLSYLRGTGNELANVITGANSTEWGDVLTGAGGDDDLRGLAGDDMLIGGSGGDRLDGGDDYDTASFATGSGGVVVNLVTGKASGRGLGNDTLIRIENVIGTSGADDITGHNGANRLDGGAGADILRGGLGKDTYVVDDAGDAVIEARDAGVDTVQAKLAAYTLSADVENLAYIGTGSFVGGGNGLANLITGGAGADRLRGGDGDDELRGLGGDDSLAGDAGDDRLDGGDGIDTASYEAASAGVTVNLATGKASGQGNDTLIRIENVIGTSGADVITGDARDNRLDGGAGNDILRGGRGNDTYVVNAANDVVSEADGDGIDTVRANASWTLGSGVENLVLTAAWANGTGNSLANKLVGGDGANVLTGLRGNDTLIGGNGADTFVFGTSFGRDRITDFADNDMIRMQDGLFTSFADVQAHAAQVGVDIVITLDSANIITIHNYALANMNAGDFLFA